MPAKEPMKISSSAIAYANTPNYSTETISKPAYAPPVLPANVVPDGANPAIAMDNVSYAYANLMANQGGYGFSGYPALAALSTRSEYRAFAEAISTEITRKWIRFTSDNGDDEGIEKRINELEKACEKFKLRGHIKQLSMLDALFGRAQIIANLRDQDRKTPLVLSPVTIKRKSLTGFAVIEPMWTTPQAYNSTQPDAPDFYKPNSWFMLGEEIHASRLMTLITRPVPDMLKPAFNFGGLSLTQLAEPYVENWLRTRQSVADLINNFSITALRTDMASVLSGGDGASIMARADLFTKTRSNRGLMILDKNMEEIVQTNTPLGGLHELQAQAQEQMCSVSHIPAIKLTGISPSGLNASSDGEFKAWYDWVAAQQQAHYRDILDTCIKIIQLSEFGEINPDIRWEFAPIEEMSEKERADIRMIDSQVAGAMIDRGVLDPQEERERLARDKHSGYNGLDLNIEVGQQGDEDDDLAQDADRWITVHPNGKDAKGQPALIGENGEVKAGMGGKFNGKNIKDAHGTKQFTSGETNAETAERNKEESAKKEHDSLLSEANRALESGESLKKPEGFSDDDFGLMKDTVTSYHKNPNSQERYQKTLRRLANHGDETQRKVAKEVMRTLGIPEKDSNAAEYEDIRFGAVENGNSPLHDKSSLSDETPKEQIAQPSQGKKTPKLKQGNISIKTPLNATKTSFGDYSVEGLPSGEYVDAKHLTIKNGKVIGMHPDIAKRIGAETHGEVQGVTEKAAVKNSEKSRIETEQKARHEEHLRTQNAIFESSQANQKRLNEIAKEHGDDFAKSIVAKIKESGVTKYTAGDVNSAIAANEEVSKIIDAEMQKKQSSQPVKREYSAEHRAAQKAAQAAVNALPQHAIEHHAKETGVDAIQAKKDLLLDANQNSAKSAEAVARLMQVENPQPQPVIEQPKPEEPKPEPKAHKYVAPQSIGEYVMPQGHERVAEHLPIEIETEKAYGVTNPNYNPQPSGYYGRHRAAKGEQFDNDKVHWLPKSQVGAHEGVVVSMPSWFAQKRGYSTHETESRRAEAFEAGKSRYNELLAQAKAAGVKGVRSMMKTETIKQKMREHGLAVDMALDEENEGLDYMNGIE